MRTKADYIAVIRQFYNCLLCDTPINLEKTNTFFGEEATAEMEEYLFYQECKRKGVSERNCSKKFDYYYGTSNPESLYFLKIKEQRDVLTQGLKESEVIEILQTSSDLIDDGEPGAILIDILFPNQKHLYFAIGSYPDEPPYIGEIFLPNGASVINSLYPEHNRFLDLLGEIDDPDGYINVRKLPDINSPVIGKIKLGERFVYTPDYNKTWWKVQKLDNPILSGYVYYDRVYPYKNRRTNE